MAPDTTRTESEDTPQMLQRCRVGLNDLAAWIKTAKEDRTSLQRELAEARALLREAAMYIGIDVTSQLVKERVLEFVHRAPGPSDAKGETLTPLTDPSVRGVLVDDGVATNKLEPHRLYVDDGGACFWPQEPVTYNVRRLWHPVRLCPASEFGRDMTVMGWCNTFFTAGPLRNAATAGAHFALGDRDIAEQIGLAARKEESDDYERLKNSAKPTPAEPAQKLVPLPEGAEVYRIELGRPGRGDFWRLTESDAWREAGGHWSKDAARVQVLRKLDPAPYGVPAGEELECIACGRGLDHGAVCGECEGDTKQLSHYAKANEAMAGEVQGLRERVKQLEADLAESKACEEAVDTHADKVIRERNGLQERVRELEAQNKQLCADLERVADERDGLASVPGLRPEVERLAKELNAANVALAMVRTCVDAAIPLPADTEAERLRKAIEAAISELTDPGPYDRPKIINSLGYLGSALTPPTAASGEAECPCDIERGCAKGDGVRVEGKCTLELKSAARLAAESGGNTIPTRVSAPWVIEDEAAESRVGGHPLTDLGWITQKAAEEAQAGCDISAGASAPAAESGPEILNGRLPDGAAATCRSCGRLSQVFVDDKCPDCHESAAPAVESEDVEYVHRLKRDDDFIGQAALVLGVHKPDGTYRGLRILSAVNALSARLAACEKRCKELEAGISRHAKRTSTGDMTTADTDLWSLLAPKAEGGRT